MSDLAWAEAEAREIVYRVAGPGLSYHTRRRREKELAERLTSLSGGVLDAAWRAAETALPVDWRIVDVRRLFHDPNERLWAATAAYIKLDEQLGGEFYYTEHVEETDVSPAAALLSLAAALRER